MICPNVIWNSVPSALQARLGNYLPYLVTVSIHNLGMWLTVVTKYQINIKFSELFTKGAGII